MLSSCRRSAPPGRSRASVIHPHAHRRAPACVPSVVDPAATGRACDARSGRRQRPCRSVYARSGSRHGPTSRLGPIGRTRWKPVPDDWSAHDRYDARAHQSSAELWHRLNRGVLLTAAAGLGGVAFGALTGHPHTVDGRPASGGSGDDTSSPDETAAFALASPTSKPPRCYEHRRSPVGANAESDGLHPVKHGADRATLPALLAGCSSRHELDVKSDVAQHTIERHISPDVQQCIDAYLSCHTTSAGTPTGTAWRRPASTRSRGTSRSCAHALRNVARARPARHPARSITPTCVPSAPKSVVPVNRTAAARPTSPWLCHATRRRRACEVNCALGALQLTGAIRRSRDIARRRMYVTAIVRRVWRTTGSRAS